MDSGGTQCGPLVGDAVCVFEDGVGSIVGGVSEEAFDDSLFAEDGWVMLVVDDGSCFPAEVVVIVSLGKCVTVAGLSGTEAEWLFDALCDEGEEKPVVCDKNPVTVKDLSGT